QREARGEGGGQGREGTADRGRGKFGGEWHAPPSLHDARAEPGRLGLRPLAAPRLHTGGGRRDRLLDRREAGPAAGGLGACNEMNRLFRYRFDLQVLEPDLAAVVLEAEEALAREVLERRLELVFRPVGAL